MWWNSFYQWKKVSWPIKLLVLFCLLIVLFTFAGSFILFSRHTSK